MDILLWVLAVILVVAGVWQLLIRNILFGILLIVVGLIIGPFGVSLWNW